jgi:hypothetical protein
MKNFFYFVVAVLHPLPPSYLVTCGVGLAAVLHSLPPYLVTCGVAAERAILAVEEFEESR